MSEGDFWNNKEKAQQQVEEVSLLRGKVNPLLQLERQIEDFEVLISSHRRRMIRPRQLRKWSGSRRRSSRIWSSLS